MKKILLSIFLSTIFMANVVAMAGTCDDYNIETRNDNGVEVYSVLEMMSVTEMKLWQKFYG